MMMVKKILMITMIVSSMTMKISRVNQQTMKMMMKIGQRKI